MYSLIFFSFRNLLFLKNYSGNVEELSLNFTVVNNDLGESQVIRAASFHIIFLLSWNTLPSPPSKLKCDAGLPHPSPPPPLPSAHASEAILYRCFTGCGVKTRWSRYSCHHQQQNQLYSSCGRLQAEQTGQSEKSLFTTYLFCLVIKSGGFVYTHILLCCYFTLGLIVANLRS